ncbi:MAG: CDGSH iron-sulfur domain-containing protein [Methylovulum sp.]|uniref:CDGSH iron-sulfur domain-containing protein n=1 Tax=Methylovulum sp. TaxID=1916980 RepID=UPI002630A899|nr:CDGSH iron-sulfur domain-containing protein [Methylovulum sp.]MDD2724738.1 CDGSH iron-sulfur domain-containing protein [Methylovulum sp.]MDD5124749.1 CDGSH iron-sulfur domain-containing protein [Methylovulum sp.]
MTNKTNSPLPVEVKAGRIYSWCQCGLSEDMPLCDNTHSGRSNIKSFKFMAEETTTLYLCACAATQTPPYCDGGQQCKTV